MIDESAQIHPNAVIGEGATIGQNCRIGAFCVVGPEVSLGHDVVLENHVSITGQTSIGAGCHIWPFASIGSVPQDLKYRGEKTRVEIGENNRIREYVTINSGTDGGGGLTRLGDNNLLMMHVHLAHDCLVDSNVIFANGVQVAGHVEIGDNAVLGSMCGVHQFCRIGQGAMIGAGAMVLNDVVPYATVNSQRAQLGGLNLIGLKRRGEDKAAINELRRVYKDLFFGEGTLQARAQALAASSQTHLAQDMVAFVLANSDRAFCAPE
jgi:UDP-N-acetylglucosamine acyltransferase